MLNLPWYFTKHVKYGFEDAPDISSTASALKIVAGIIWSVLEYYTFGELPYKHTKMGSCGLDLWKPTLSCLLWWKKGLGNQWEGAG